VSLPPGRPKRDARLGRFSVVKKYNVCVHTQKARERHLLDRFAKAYPEFPSGDIVDSESPDFLIKSPDRTIGIEVMEYHARGPRDGKGGPQQRLQLEMCKRVVARARDEYERTSDVPLWISCLWSPGMSLLRSDLKPLSAELAKLVGRSIPPGPSATVELGLADLEGTLFEDKIASLRIRRRPYIDRNMWVIPGAAFIAVDPAEVELLISEKEAKVHQYRQKCDAAWLLIVASGEDIVSTGELTAAAHEHCFETAFDRVIWFDYLDGRSFTLKSDESYVNEARS
jgi:hypothetical protein